MDVKSTLPAIAYFSMEIALEADIPTYSGGLGVLAGDTLRSAADMHVPIVAVSLVHRKGYFRQHLDPGGNQYESPQQWEPGEQLASTDARVQILLEGRQVTVRAWQYTVRGCNGGIVPVYLLDTDTPENSAWDRGLTDHLYGGDEHYRLCQELILGIGGMEILRKLGHDVKLYHMNEGHSALLALALLERRLAQSFAGRVKKGDIDGVRRACIFTTHTPVPAGHDQFNRGLAEQVLGEERTALITEAQAWNGEVLNMTFLALRFSG